MKPERLILRVEKAGVRASLRSGHLVSEDELLGLRIQIVPLTLRIASAASALASAWASYTFYSAGAFGWALGFGLLAFFLLLFAILGFKRTLTNILDGLDSAASADLISAALEGVAAVVGSIFD